jgi:hypothetical protein
MKKIVLTLLLAAAGTASMFAQGTVTFGNSTSLFATAADRYVYLNQTGVAANLLKGTQYRANLYFSQTAGGAFTLVDANPAAFRSTTTASPGTWVQQDKIVPGVQGTTVFLQVRVWDSTFGTTYETRTGGFSGISDAFSWKLPVSGQDPASAQIMEGLRSFAVVPEPGTFALAGLGLLGLVMARRRK